MASVIGRLRPIKELGPEQPRPETKRQKLRRRWLTWWRTSEIDPASTALVILGVSILPFFLAILTSAFTTALRWLWLGLLIVAIAVVVFGYGWFVARQAMKAAALTELLTPLREERGED